MTPVWQRRPSLRLKAISSAITAATIVVAVVVVGAGRADSAILFVAPGEGSTQPGGSTSADVRVDSGEGSSILVATGAPHGVSVTFDPQTGPPTAGQPQWTSRMTVSTSRDTPPGEYTITIIERRPSGLQRDTAPYRLNVNPPPTTAPPPPPTTTTTARATTTTTAATTTTASTTPTTTLGTTTTEAPTTTAVPVSPFTAIAELRTAGLPDRVLFVPFVAPAYGDCLPLTGFCADPAGGLMLLPADMFDVTWAAPEHDLAGIRDDFPALDGVGSTPEGAGAARLLLPVVRADGSIAAVIRRATTRGLIPARQGPPALSPQGVGPELEDPPPPPATAPFRRPIITNASTFTDASPVLVAASGSITILYGFEPDPAWRLNRDLIPLLGDGAVPHLAIDRTGRAGLAIPVPEGLVVPPLPAERARSVDDEGIAVRDLALPAAAIVAVLVSALGLFRLIPRRRRARECRINLDHRWDRPRFLVNWVGPSGAGQTSASRPFPLAVRATGERTLIVTASCEHRCGEPNRGPTHQRFAVPEPAELRWSLVGGGGGFVPVDEAPAAPQGFGEQVLYMPPELAVGERREVRVRIEATTVPTERAPAGSREVYDTIDITISLRCPAAGILEVDVASPGARDFDPSTAPVVPEEQGECVVTMAARPKKATCTIHPVAADFLAVGDIVQLRAEASAIVEFTVRAEADEHCVAAQATLPVVAPLSVEWSSSAGTFPAGEHTSTVIFQTPTDPASVTVTLGGQAAGDADDDRVSTSATATLDIAALGIDLVAVPREWLPDARAGRAMTVARIYRQERGEWVYPGRRRFVTFRLQDVSRERGVCMNYPPREVASANPDLFFSSDDNDGYALSDDATVDNHCPTEILTPGDNPPHQRHDQTAVSRTAVTEARILIRCEDYAAFGALVAVADDCVPLASRRTAEAAPASGGGSNRIMIPRDDNANGIADSAPHDANGAAADADADATPAGDGTLGDGFTNYEEYRGFVIGGGTEGRRHVRTDIGTKDVFVHDEHNLGLGHFDATGLAIHVLRDAALYDGDDSRVVNFNRGHATGGAQHGIRLVREPLNGPRQLAVGGPGTPGAIERVAIDSVALVAEGIPGMGERARAHGLAHAVNIRHHGHQRKHAECAPHTEPEGGESSGDVQCVMRYTEYAAGWCHDANHHHHAHELPDAVGTAFCTSSAGTGTNAADGHRNDAAAGDCVGQLRVKDW